MGRSELIQRLILSEISDDYENVDQLISPHVARDGARIGLTIERTEIVASLVENDLALAYLLSGTEPFSTELAGMPRIDAVGEDFQTYFYIT